MKAAGQNIWHFDLFCLVLFHEQSETKGCFIFNDIKQRKAANASLEKLILTIYTLVVSCYVHNYHNSVTAGYPSLLLIFKIFFLNLNLCHFR